jgi:hypothetical protein
MTESDAIAAFLVAVAYNAHVAQLVAELCSFGTRRLAVALPS